MTQAESAGKTPTGPALETVTAPGSADRALDFHPVIPIRWEIWRTAADTDGELFEATEWLDPHMFAGPPVHVHPFSEENFNVVEGELDIFMQGEWRSFGAGDTVRVPAGIAHTWRNSSDRAACVLAVHRPAVQFEDFHRGLAALIANGKVRSLPPKEPRSAIYLSMLCVEYQRFMIVKRPPNAVLEMMARVGKLLGFKLND